MSRSSFRRRERRGSRSRVRGCLLWVLLLIVILIVLSLMFGGFQKGTKSRGLGAWPVVAASAQRLDPAASALKAAGPHGAIALRLVRTYAR